MWMKYGLIDEIEYVKLAESNQSKASIKTRLKIAMEASEYYETIHDFILNNKFKYTIHDVNEIFGSKSTDTTLMKNLLHLYSDNFERYLIHGVKSKEEEVQYLNILRFFFGNSNIIYGFKLEGRLFDALLFDKILIEYDGSYYHSSEKAKERDKEKDKIAKRNGYILIRINEVTSKDINTLKKIEKYVKKIQAKKNRNSRDNKNKSN